MEHLTCCQCIVGQDGVFFLICYVAIYKKSYSRSLPATWIFNKICHYHCISYKILPHFDLSSVVGCTKVTNIFQYEKIFSLSFLYVIGSQCSAGTVCLTCWTLSLWWPVWQWKGQLCPHSISLIRVRGNMTICSWITKLHWLWSFYGFELSCWMDVYYLHCYSPLCLCFLATNILNQSNSLGSRSGWRQDTINLTRFHSPFQWWFNGNHLVGKKIP